MWRYWGSSAALTAKLELFLGRRYFNSLVMPVKRLVCLAQLGLLFLLCLVEILFLFSLV